jgi:hypothetical protein
VLRRFGGVVVPISSRGNRAFSLVREGQAHCFRMDINLDVCVVNSC